jgi:hypothetical protein
VDVEFRGGQKKLIASRSSSGRIRLCAHPALNWDSIPKISPELAIAVENIGQLKSKSNLLSLLPHKFRGCGRGGPYPAFPAKESNKMLMAPVQSPSSFAGHINGAYQRYYCPFIERKKIEYKFKCQLPEGLFIFFMVGVSPFSPAL